MSRKHPPLPNQTAVLGACDELHVKPEKGRTRVFRGGRDSWLLSDSDGDALLIVRPENVDEVNLVMASKDAKKVFKLWSEFEVNSAFKLSVSETPLKHYLGRARVIRYASEKWSGKTEHYEHKFETSDFQVWGDSTSSPRKILVTAFPPRHLVTCRGIVG